MTSRTRCHRGTSQKRRAKHTSLESLSEEAGALFGVTGGCLAPPAAQWYPAPPKAKSGCAPASALDAGSLVSGAAGLATLCASAARAAVTTTAVSSAPRRFFSAATSGHTWSGFPPSPTAEGAAAEGPAAAGFVPGSESPDGGSAPVTGESPDGSAFASLSPASFSSSLSGFSGARPNVLMKRSASSLLQVGGNDIDSGQQNAQLL